MSELLYNGEFCTKFYDMVPKDFDANIIWRREVIEMCRDDESARADFWDMCSRDILFYINTFQFTLNPRSLEQPIIPFITYEYQDEIICDAWNIFGKEDIGVEKSRDMGMTWIWLLMIEYHWRFREYLTFLLLSQKQEMVYKKGNEKALFSKIEFLHKFQPPWLLPNMQMTELHLGNLDNNSSIDGESTTDTSSTGDRRTVIFCDEFAKLKINDGYKILQSTRAVSNCRIFNSTHFGINNAFYDLTRGDKKFKNVFKMMWWRRPEFGAGLYKVFEDGHIEIIDTDYDFGDYEFSHELPENKEGLRSPWYDEQVKRTLSKHELAEEIDCNPIGGSYSYFQSVVDRLKIHCRVPITKGTLIYSDKGVLDRYDEIEDGEMRLWCAVDPNTGLPLQDEYVMGVDIGAGAGASNSTITVANVRTGEKVCEVASSELFPYQWARYAIAVAEFFHGAKMCWEANGPTGREFGITIRDLGYNNIYYRQNKETGKETLAPGWHSDPETKAQLLGEYRQALAMGEFKNYSKLALEECLDYIRETNGDLVHRKSKNLTDPSGAGASHGDRVIADALCNWIMKGRSRFLEEQETTPEVPEYSLAGRIMADRRKKAQEAEEKLAW